MECDIGERGEERINVETLVITWSRNVLKILIFEDDDWKMMKKD